MNAYICSVMKSDTLEIHIYIIEKYKHDPAIIAIHNNGTQMRNHTSYIFICACCHINLKSNSEGCILNNFHKMTNTS